MALIFVIFIGFQSYFFCLLFLLASRPSQKELMVSLLLFFSFIVFTAIIFDGMLNAKIQLYPVAQQIELPEFSHVFEEHSDPEYIEKEVSNKTNLLAKEIQEQIPLGSPVRNVQKVMDLNKYSCKSVKNGSYTQVISMYENYRLFRGNDHKNVDFIDCKIPQSDLEACITLKWETYIEYKRGKVTNILVSATHIETPGFYDDYCRLEYLH